MSGQAVRVDHHAKLVSTLSTEEDIPWKCHRLIVGTGVSGALPVMQEVEREAQARNVELVKATTEQAINELVQAGKGANAILHVTC